MGRPPAWVLGEMLTSPHRTSISMLQIVTLSLGLGRNCCNEIKN
jgi:hypothetical protein